MSAGTSTLPRGSGFMLDDCRTAIPIGFDDLHRNMDFDVSGSVNALDRAVAATTAAIATLDDGSGEHEHEHATTSTSATRAPALALVIPTVFALDIDIESEVTLRTHSAERAEHKYSYSYPQKGQRRVYGQMNGTLLQTMLGRLYDRARSSINFATGKRHDGAAIFRGSVSDPTADAVDVRVATPLHDLSAYVWSEIVRQWWDDEAARVSFADLTPLTTGKVGAIEDEAREGSADGKSLGWESAVYTFEDEVEGGLEMEMEEGNGQVGRGRVRLPAVLVARYVAGSVDE